MTPDVSYTSVMRHTTFRLPDDVRVALARAASADDRTMNGEAVALLRYGLRSRGFLPIVDGDPHSHDVCQVESPHSAPPCAGPREDASA